ncbi:hypothetical protein BD410DRAFT_790464 [Rickenella mellea]|uniref:Transcription initiation factor IIF subunit beta n=1 Tax=Rickenella mellea TaxID=50990 RepID=A0A4Y7Q0V6_9AGAM|nr:hypothetical protein BD410DRAFT_790464 [Rickenella mellea]
MEKWSAIEEDDIHLGTIRVYNKEKPDGKKRIVLILPPDTDSTEPDEYELDMVNDDVPNQIVVAEREKAPGSRARTTILTGRIKHDCNLRPSFSEKYRKRMRERHIAANTPTRQIRLIDEVMTGGRGSVNMLSSGITAAGGFSSLVKPKAKAAKGTFERFARMPRNQLLDLLFALYRERPRWSAKELRTRTEQPEAYLKEVLAEIADLHRSGEYNGLYELKPNFQETGKYDPDAFGSGSGLHRMSQDDVDMDDAGDDDDDDEDDMEKVELPDS